ncbi:MAG TPA: response regulator [Candidatus Thermoplasmatota archaeon]|nr:response regulator [Candidatus Thermoplasmatota archaeon]
MRACLIVDDSQTVRRAVAAAVRATRKVEEVHEAGDPAEALQLFESRQPELVFLDMMLAGDAARDPNGESAKGLEVLRSMLASRPDTHIVVITGLPSSQPDVVDAISLGALAALRKPVKAEDIRYVLDSIQPDKARMDYFG